MAQGDIYYFGKIGKEEYNTSNKEYTLEPSSTCLEERIILMGQQIGMSQSIKKGDNLNEYIETIGEVIVKYKYINGGEDLEIDWEYKAVEDKEENSGVGKGQSTSSNTSDDEWPESYREGINKLKEKYPNWVLKKIDSEIVWDNLISAETKGETSLVYKAEKIPKSWYKEDKNNKDSWLPASKKLVEYYCDPRNFLTESKIFQFLNLSWSSLETIDGVKKMLGDCIVKEQAITLYSAAKKFGVSAYYLTSKFIVETGCKKSGQKNQLLYGTVTDLRGWYNPFNFGAYGDSDSIVFKRGALYAKERGWNSLEIAIIEGTNEFSKKFIQIGQDTIYTQKFDIIGPSYYSHQYMQNIQVADTESGHLYNAFKDNSILDSKLIFKIPVFKNMPLEKLKKPE